MKKTHFYAAIGILGATLGTSAAFVTSPVKSQDEVKTRTVDYSEGVNNSSFEGFENHEVIEDGDLVIVKASKTYQASFFQGLDLVRMVCRDADMMGGGGGSVTVNYQASVNTKTGITKISAAFVNAAVKTSSGSTISNLQMIDGIVTYNKKGQRDVLFADKDGDVWLSDLQSGNFNNVGFWDWVKQVVNTVKDAVQDVVDTVVEVAQTVINDVVKFANKTMDDIKEFLENPIDNIVTFLKNPITGSVEIGRNVVQNACDSFGLENGAKLLCMSPDSSGVYHASQKAWQTIGGYNDLYDAIFHIGTSMDKMKWEFTVDNQDYILWAWKGDYWSLGCGAELGIYARLNNSQHWYVDWDLALEMSMKVYLCGNKIIDWKDSEKNWWMTAFNPKHPRAKMENIEVEYDIGMITKGKSCTFDSKMKTAFTNKWVDKNTNSSWKSKTNGHFGYTFKSKVYWQHC